MRAKPSPQSPQLKKEPKSPGNYVDVFVKRMFSHMVVVVDFLLFYADPNFVSEIDTAEIKPAPTHYIGKIGDERIADLIFQCPLKDGSGNVMAVIIFEHQSGRLKNIPRKLHRYISAIWDAETKEGKKVLSAPYFIVLRTGKKPHRGPYPKMSDSLPKGRDGKPLGKVVEIEYDVVDLPDRDFRKLLGGPQLRLALGILKTMLEGHEDEFPEALLPLLEITDQELRVELWKELLQFVDKALRAHNRQVDDALMKKALEPIFKNEVNTMIKSIFDEKYEEGVVFGEAKGKAEGKAEMLVQFLSTRFKRVPKSTRDRLLAINDAVVLESLVESVLHCESLKEFEKALK
jgi:hypothetical protein